MNTHINKGLDTGSKCLITTSSANLLVDMITFLQFVLDLGRNEASFDSR